MKKSSELDIRGTIVRVAKINGEDYVCLTDMAKLKSEDAQQTISNWMRNRMTLEYLGLWEELYNPDFKPLGFEGFRKEVGLNHFTMSPGKWIGRLQRRPRRTFNDPSTTFNDLQRHSTKGSHANPRIRNARVDGTRPARPLLP